MVAVSTRPAMSIVAHSPHPLLSETPTQRCVPAWQCWKAAWLLCVKQPSGRARFCVLRPQCAALATARRQVPCSQLCQGLTRSEDELQIHHLSIQQPGRALMQLQRLSSSQESCRHARSAARLQILFALLRIDRWSRPWQSLLCADHCPRPCRHFRHQGESILQLHRRDLQPRSRACRHLSRLLQKRMQWRTELLLLRRRMLRPRRRQCRSKQSSRLPLQCNRNRRRYHPLV